MHFNFVNFKPTDMMCAKTSISSSRVQDRFYFILVKMYKELELHNTGLGYNIHEDLFVLSYKEPCPVNHKLGSI